MQDNTSHKIDDIFKAGMTQLPEEEPSISGWEDMKKRMQKEGIKLQEEKKSNRYLWLSLSATVLLVAGAATYYMVGNNNKLEEASKEVAIAGTKENDKIEHSTINPSVATAEITEEEDNKIAEETTESKEKSISAVETAAIANTTKPEADKTKSKKTSMLSVYSIRVASFSGKVEDPELNAIPNLKSEYNASEDATTFYIGGFKSKEEAITGMKRIQREFNSRIDPNDAASQKNLKDAYVLFEEELNKL